MRVSTPISVLNANDFKTKLLQWSKTFTHVAYLESNAIKNQYSSYDALVAVNALKEFKVETFRSDSTYFTELQKLNDWVFGHFSYDIKNTIEALESNNYDGLHFPEVSFFLPEYVFVFKENSVHLKTFQHELPNVETLIKEIENFEPIKELDRVQSSTINQRVSKTAYLSTVQTLLEHIKRGDIYEINYCIEFFADAIELNPLKCFNYLNTISTAPFSAFLKQNHNYLLSASPERYLKRYGNTVISQPIKGTAKRYKNKALDELSKRDLEQSPKERSENIMIVDLVRNDLSKTALKGKVNVDELCKVYSFKQVHQLISTIRSEIKTDTSLKDLIVSTFPMGSMTGAPKIAAMKLIEQYEKTKRGLYSGCVGYITPNGDFDFNVVIRSILYNANTKYASYMVGSAITANSLPESEYEECLLKAKALAEAITNAN